MRGICAETQPELAAEQTRWVDAACRHARLEEGWLHRQQPDVSAAQHDVFARVVTLFANPAEFFNLPLLYPLQTTASGGRTGYLDYLRSNKDITEPVMRGFDRLYDRPFVVVRFKFSPLEDTETGHLILFQSNPNSPEWLVHPRGEPMTALGSIAPLFGAGDEDPAGFWNYALIKRLVAGEQVFVPAGEYVSAGTLTVG